jgi:hypothetical protein
MPRFPWLEYIVGISASIMLVQHSAWGWVALAFYMGMLTFTLVMRGITRGIDRKLTAMEAEIEARPSAPVIRGIDWPPPPPRS